jgi:hypothetical protein
MVALELFVASGLYTAGNVTKYFFERMALKDGSKLRDGTEVGPVETPIEKFVECSVEVRENDAPIYVNTGGQHPGFLVPFGGGSHLESRNLLTAVIGKDPKDSVFHWTVTDLESRPCAVPRRFWLNTADDLKQYFDTNGIPQTIAPLSLPMAVREVTVPAGRTVYGSKQAAVAGTELDRVIRRVASRRSIGRERFLWVGLLASVTGVLTWNNWENYSHNAAYYKKSRTLRGFVEWLN